MRRSAEFADAIRAGARSGGRRVVVHYHHSGSTRDEPARVGFVVSKAVGGAVQRNLVKRRMRAALRAEVQHLPRGSAVVVRALPAANGSSFAELRDDVVHRLGRARRSEEGRR